MAEQLSDLLHRSFDDVDVPRPDAYRITAQGRTLRTRRRVGTALVAAVLVAAVGGGLAYSGSLGGEPRGAQIATGDDGRSEAVASYDDGGAWYAQGRVTIGDRSVKVDGVAHLAQTSVGVVARQSFAAGWSYVLVRPDGTLALLSIPPSVGHVEGALDGPRVAWVEAGADQLVVHVWDVTTDSEVGTVTRSAPSTRAGDPGEFIRVARLDDDKVYFTTDDGTSIAMDWTTGAATVLPYPVSSVHRGIAIGLDGDRSVVYDTVADRVLRRLGANDANPEISPDGGWVLSTDYGGEAAVTSVERAAGGDRVALDGVEGLARWTLAGNVLAATARGVRVCDTAGGCRDRAVDAGDGMVLIADFLNVG